jgi:hypothetical protein
MNVPNASRITTDLMALKTLKKRLARVEALANLRIKGVRKRTHCWREPKRTCVNVAECSQAYHCLFPFCHFCKVQHRTGDSTCVGLDAERERKRLLGIT